LSHYSVSREPPSMISHFPRFFQHFLAEELRDDLNTHLIISGCLLLGGSLKAKCKNQNVKLQN